MTHKTDKTAGPLYDYTDIVEDGFGTSAPAICPTCGYRAVYVCRPGDIRCGVCCDNNPKEYYTGAECSECGFNAVRDGKCLCCKGDSKTKPKTADRINTPLVGTADS